MSQVRRIAARDKDNKQRRKQTKTEPVLRNKINKESGEWFEVENQKCDV